MMEKELLKSVRLNEHKPNASSPAIGLIGAGGFGQIFSFRNQSLMEFVSVAKARPYNARNIADKYGFSSCTGNTDEVGFQNLMLIQFYRD